MGQAGVFGSKGAEGEWRAPERLEYFKALCAVKEVGGSYLYSRSTVEAAAEIRLYQAR